MSRAPAEPASWEPRYGDFLRLDTLLSLQRESAEAHDAHFFFTVHQVYELQFKIVLYELDAAVAAVAADDIPRAVYCLRRVRAVEEILVAQVATLETISPGGFAALRGTLAGSSGLQSVQFREIEFLSGLKDPDYLTTTRMSEPERTRLERRMAEPSLWDEFRRLRTRQGDPDLVELYRAEVPGDGLVRLAEAMIEHDEGFGLWRARHVPMVERLIGRRRGTGGSAGVAYLHATTAKRFYPELWDLRARV
ncbi:tryptophan 2,3-dioxygenase family protein [Actinomadura macrotermitis]|uniref:Tryptophan 2,3-dioxygenase n=1 Tax=Actinomadura macrotermitis TaxID=2585200 RepID=A0A7K0BUE6_9ACTN|nr:tryptophan 2,3-dioxygenase family protein [Actinomadura macrotermitis]MQY04656.1 Tryptophan 2,3-dioxygenase [Actinomadura macrotermitis]